MNFNWRQLPRINANNISQEIKDFIWDRANKHNWFYTSLLDSLVKFDGLTARQLMSIEKDMARVDLPKPQFTEPPTIKVGQILELRRGWADRLKNNHGMKYFFRNLEVTKVERETDKAVLVKVVFSTKIITSCNYCGRSLDCSISKACGIGPICLKHMGIARPNLETAHETLKMIEEVVKSIGELGPVWIPKSQIKPAVEKELEVA